MKIAIFGGTFNPIHNGHLNIVKLIKQKYNFDYVYMVPTYKTPSKFFFPEKIKPKVRFKIVKKTIESENLDWLKVSNFEIKRKGYSYTWKTIKHFKNKYPNDKLFLIMGDDRYVDFSTWKNYEYIKNNSKIIVLKRDVENDYDFSNHNIEYYKDSIFEVSSNQIIKNCQWDKLPEITKKEIAKRKLYLKAINFYKTKDHGDLYEHVLSAATHAKRLAQRNFMFFKSKNAYLAGLIHDMFKYENNTWQLNYIHRNSDLIPPATPALHGVSLALWLKKEYLLKDEDIINSISKHTLSSKDMNKFEKIIYVADKISNTRKDSDSKRYRKLAYINLNKTFNLILINQINKLKLKGVSVDENTMESYNKFILKK